MKCLLHVLQFSSAYESRSRPLKVALECMMGIFSSNAAVSEYSSCVDSRLVPDHPPQRGDNISVVAALLSHSYASQFYFECRRQWICLVHPQNSYLAGSTTSVRFDAAQNSRFVSLLIAVEYDNGIMERMSTQYLLPTRRYCYEINQVGGIYHVKRKMCLQLENNGLRPLL